MTTPEVISNPFNLNPLAAKKLPPKTEATVRELALTYLEDCAQVLGIQLKFSSEETLCKGQNQFTINYNGKLSDKEEPLSAQEYAQSKILLQSYVSKVPNLHYVKLLESVWPVDHDGPGVNFFALKLCIKSTTIDGLIIDLTIRIQLDYKPQMH